MKEFFHYRHLDALKFCNRKKIKFQTKSLFLPLWYQLNGSSKQYFETAVLLHVASIKKPHYARNEHLRLERCLKNYTKILAQKDDQQQRFDKVHYGRLQNQTKQSRLCYSNGRLGLDSQSVQKKL